MLPFVANVNIYIKSNGTVDLSSNNLSSVTFLLKPGIFKITAKYFTSSFLFQLLLFLITHILDNLFQHATTNYHRDVLVSNFVT